MMTTYPMTMAAKAEQYNETRVMPNSRGKPGAQRSSDGSNLAPAALVTAAPKATASNQATITNHWFVLGVHSGYRPIGSVAARTRSICNYAFFHHYICKAIIICSKAFIL